MTEYRGIGNFTGEYKCRGKTYSFGPNLSEPLHEKTGEPLLGPHSLTVRVACGLFNRDGYWPGWFLWAVGDPPPSRFRKFASALAMDQVRQEKGPAVSFLGRPQHDETKKEKAKSTTGTSAFVAGAKLVVLPSHVCRGRPGEPEQIFATDCCGPVGADLRGRCTTRRAWERRGKIVVSVDHPGCGKVFVVNKDGVRVEAA